ncbi:MAG TPA: SpoIIE family protein phosphatase [Vicinamibacterales bacterium]
MTGSRILVVDDEPGIIRAVERVLGDIHHVCGTSSSKDAVSLAAEFLPELAIVDIRMPDVDGFELMARLKMRLPKVDVILMTGSVDDLDEKLVRAIKSPAFYFIQKPFDREVLKTLVERCLELQWRREAHRRHLQHLEDELSQARTFQQSLLPQREATFNGLSVCSQYLPCSGIGGDLYDYAAADSGQTALLVADVSGHGLSAAMMTSVVKSAFHAARVDGYDPLTVVHRVWSSLAAFGPEKFVTLFAALIVPQDSRLRYVSAGHPPGVLWKDARDPVWLASTGPLISPALPASLWAIESVAMRAGDRLLLYTDGVTDALGADDDTAPSQIIDAIHREADGGMQLLDAILADVQQKLDGSPQPDDITLMTARRANP